MRRAGIFLEGFAMWYEYGSNDKILATIMMRVISMTNNGDGAAAEIAELVTGLLGSPESVVIIEPTSQRPTMVKLTFSQVDVVCMTGVRHANHIVNVVRGLTQGAWITQYQGRWTGALPFNGFALEAAKNCLDALGWSYERWGAKPRRIYAHSYGAFLAPIMAWLGHTAEANNYQYVTLIGGPRVGFRELFDSMGTVSVTDFWNINDPVPYLIPNATQSPASQNLILPSVRPFIERLVHNDGGTEIQEGGSTLWKAQPTIVGYSPGGNQTDPLLALLMWTSGIQGFAHPSHTHLRYAEQFGRMLDYAGRTWDEYSPATRAANNQSVATTHTQTTTQEPLAMQPMPTVTLLPGQTVTPAPGLAAAFAETQAMPTLSRTNMHPIVIDGVTVGYSRSRGHARRSATKGRQLKLLLSGALEVDPGSVGEACT